MGEIKIGDKVLYEGKPAIVIDRGTMFIADSWWIEYDGDQQVMVMGSNLEKMETDPK